VLILDANPNGQASIGAYRFGRRLQDAVVTGAINGSANNIGSGRLFPAAYDFAFAPATDSTSANPGNLYLVDIKGNQAFRFSLTWLGDQLQCAATLDYFPMRLFSGMGVVAADDEVFYDSNLRWVHLVKQDRPQYLDSAEIVSPTLDGREPGCVWHRLILDACLPSDSTVSVWSRASDDPDLIEHAQWYAEPPFYRRGDGSELPFVPRPSSKDRGTFELLFQAACGRYLQVKLSLSGNGRSTPRLRALRFYYPRFSYLTHYLPAVYREDRASASFLDRFLANVEGTNTAIEDKIASVQMLFDPVAAPSDALSWLASWFGIALDPTWGEPHQRLLLRKAMRFFQWRGTIRGLQMALHLAMDDSVDDSIFNPPGAGCRCQGPSAAPSGGGGRCQHLPDKFRIVEKFLLRRAPAVDFGDADDFMGLQNVQTANRWNPNMGVSELRRRFLAWSNRKDWMDFDLGDTTPPKPLPSDQVSARLAFAQRELGFETSEVMEDQLAWRDFLRGRYSSIADLSTAYNANWNDFDQIPIPSDQPQGEAWLSDWQSYIVSTASEPFGIKRAQWQDFLARRYGGIGQLNAKHSTHWETFGVISYPTTLPSQTASLWDWYQFESLVLPTFQLAHRFSVLLPFTGATLPAVEDRLQRLELARRLIELEKPAHTAFDVKFYWALFRLGDARLGLDTVLGLGGRDPALLPPAVLGQTYLAETRLIPGYPYDVTQRQIIGRDRLN
jgi:phage tail-like protein